MVNQLVERIRNKDQRAMSELYQMYIGELSSVCYRYIPNSDDAKDVLQNSFRVEFYSPDSTKMKKQMSYANAKQIPFVALAGENEMAADKLTLKNMETGEQSLITIDEIIKTILA